MKKIIFICTLLILIVNQGKSQTGWFIQPAFTAKNLYGVGISPVYNVYVGSDSGIVFESTNSGYNWVLLTQDTAVKRLPIRSIFSQYNDDFNAVGDSAAYILKVGQQVSSSRIVSSPGLIKPNLRAISFIQGSFQYQTYVAAGDSGLFYLNETGLWRKDTAATRIAAGRKINYSNNFIFVGDNGFIMKADSIGNQQSNGERIKWRIITSGTSQNLYNVRVASSGICLAVGGGGTILKSTDFGDTWIQVSSPVQDNLYCINFSYASLICGANGTILKCLVNTLDNWFRQTTPTTQDLHSILALTYTDYISMGNNGIILRTTDGGGPPAGIVQVNNQIPRNFGLRQNYPNPFNPATEIEFSIPATGANGTVKLKVYDVIGNEVSVIVNENLKPGMYKVNFDASILSTGVYFYKLEYGGLSESKKMILTK